MGTLMQSGSLLKGNRTTPGSTPPKEVTDRIPEILQCCRDFGLDFYETVVEFLSYDEISEVASYGGFPVRYPHWRWGMEYEEMSRGYEHGNYRIYEMVINTSPCYIYCLDSNTLVDHVTVIAHATAHNDFFKNNIHFKPTSQNMMNELANHGTRVRRYMSEWGATKVQRFIDKVLSIETLLDHTKAWTTRRRKESDLFPRRKHYNPRRLEVKNEYMQDWINTPEWLKAEQDRIKDKELAEEVGIMPRPDKDVFGFLRDNAPLASWQQDVISMLYEEAMYFAPQGATKVINEGWASFADSQIMARYGLAGDDGIVEYALHKAGVLGGRYSTNPYKLGYMLFQHIEERWNKGRFGHEWETCRDYRQLENWDTKAGLGMEKIFEVRHLYDDVNFIAEFMDQDFVDRYQFFKWRENPDGSKEIETRDAKEIKRALINSRINRGLPDIRLTEPNFRGKRILALQHVGFDGRILNPNDTKETVAAMSFLWSGPVMLISKDQKGKEICYYIEEPTGKVNVTTPDKI